MHIDMALLTDLGIKWGIKIITAVLILLIGHGLVKWLCKLFVKVMDKQQRDITLTRFIKNCLYYALMAAVIVAAAGQIGINTASFLTIIGAAGLAVGLALKDSLSNFASGVMLILFRPFKVQDLVTVAGATGVVQEITIFNTVLHTGDNQRKVIPNSAITGDVITNVNANKTRRIDLVYGIGYDDDIKEARKIFETIVNADSRILKEPKPTIAVSELADSSVNFVVRPWVASGDYWNVFFDLNEKIKLALDEAGISIPYPQQDLHLYQIKEN
ncbi:MAG: mechanosensitive ion channel protein MscS [Proteobacteria bacterium]|nr:MAG: mechanosensitive ion channel protein MscS [Pseudomonadota bacterium]